MMRYVWRLAAVVAVATLAVTTACAPISDKTTAANPDKCTKDQLGTLCPGVLRFGTDQPVYPPWYMGDNPASGEGFDGGRLRCRGQDELREPRRAMGTGALQRRTGSWAKDVRRQPL